MSRPADQVPQANAEVTTPLRFVTAASLFDGHDAAINIMRRLIQAQGAEVIHLGHNRSVLDIVQAAIQEDADAIAISSYQGGHIEFFKYMVDLLKERGSEHIRVFGGGGGTITPDEIRELEAYGIERIYHPDDGMGMGLVEMIEDVVKRAADHRVPTGFPGQPDLDNALTIANVISALEDEVFGEAELKFKRREWQGRDKQAPVVGITGTGGAGKSSVTDELLNRFTQCYPEMKIAVLAVDPTRRRTGGALLGDRIRMNSLRNENIYMRSMATRRQHLATSAILQDAIAFLKSAGFDLVIVETAGIGQSDSEIVDMVDFPVYVMTSDFGAQSQLEKIDMLDYAELVVLNKFDKRAAEDALRDVRKQWKRNHLAFQANDDDVPVYPTIASQFNDPGITWMFVNLCRLLRAKLKLPAENWSPDVDTSVKAPKATVLIPGQRTRYLAEIAEQGRTTSSDIARQAEAASKAQNYYESLKALKDEHLPEPFARYVSFALRETTAGADSTRETDRSLLLLRQRYDSAISELSEDAIQLLRTWPARKAGAAHRAIQLRSPRPRNHRQQLQRIPKPLDDSQDRHAARR